MKFQQIKSTVRGALLPRGIREPLSANKAPIVIAGMFRTSNGIGRAAEGCFAALSELGLSPIAVDLSEGFNQTDQASSVPLSKMPKTSRGIAIVYANAPEIERALTILKLRRWNKWRLIGAWAWELPDVPHSWRKATQFLSEIWAPSQFVVDAFRSNFDIPIRRVPHFLKTPKDTSSTLVFSESDRRFSVLAMADGRSSLHRKNLIGAVEIFLRAFPVNKDVRLVLKSRNLELFETYHSDLLRLIEGDDRITLTNGNLPSTELSRLISQSDVLLSPHRSEGFGLHLAEAMAAGSVAMATNWSGNVDFMNEENSVPLPYTLGPVSDPTNIYSTNSSNWAFVDVGAAATALRALSTDLAHQTKLSAKARTDIQDLLGAHHYRSALTFDTSSTN